MRKTFYKVKGVSIEEHKKVISNCKEGQPMKFVCTSNEWCKKAIDVQTEEGLKIGSISKDYCEKIFDFIKKGKEYNLKIDRIYGVPGKDILGVILREEYE